MLFGYENDWATAHNTYIDILKHSGILGFIISLVFIYAALRKKVNIDILSKIGKNEYSSVTVFAIFVFLFDNSINTAFSTPLLYCILPMFNCQY
jgi:O-antigen ligase